MLPALYELAAEYRNAANRLADLQLDEQTIADTLEGLSGAIEEKLINVAFVIRNIESLAEQIKQAEQQMAMRRKALENRSESIRNYLKRNMEACNITEIDSPWFKIAIRNNPASLVVDDESKIPKEFFDIPDPVPVLDKKAVKEMIKNGFDVTGAHLEQKTRVEIK